MQFLPLRIFYMCIEVLIKNIVPNEDERKDVL